MHKTTSRFWSLLNEMNDDVRNAAFKNFELLKTNPYHPSLHFKKVGKYWSIRVDINHRALAMKDGDDYIWVWAGAHKEYEQIIK